MSSSGAIYCPFVNDAAGSDTSVIAKVGSGMECAFYGQFIDEGLEYNASESLGPSMTGFLEFEEATSSPYEFVTCTAPEICVGSACSVEGFVVKHSP